MNYCYHKLNQISIVCHLLPHLNLNTTIFMKQIIPVMGIICESSKLLKEKQNFVVCFTLCSLFSPHIYSSRARLNSWCVRKPLLLLTAQGGLIAQHCFQSKTEKQPILTTPIRLYHNLPHPATHYCFWKSIL